jgi:hypothetical protein
VDWDGYDESKVTIRIFSSKSKNHAPKGTIMKDLFYQCFSAY